MAQANNPKRQRQKEMRKAKIEQEIREAKAARRRRLILLSGMLVALLGLVVFAQSRATDSEPDNADDMEAIGDGPPQDLQAPEMAIDTSKTYTAVISTSLGDITVELDDEISPNTVNSFVYLANEGWYDGLIFHRIVEDFALQGGSPNGDGIGGPGYDVQDDVPSDFRYVRGVVAMAKGGTAPAGSAGSQFFIVPSDSAAERLTPDYAILGRVTDGFDVVDAMNGLQVRAAASGEVSAPIDPPTIEGIEISES